jgi:signal transduction histidine kinase
MTSEKIQRIFISVNEKVQSLLKPGRFYITLYDPRRARVEFPWVVENETNKLEWGVRELDNNLLPDHVLVNGSALHYERDVATHIKESELTYWPGDEIPASWLGVPIVFEGKTLGVMIVESNIPGAFDQRAATLLSAIAGQTATALERVRLDEDLARRIRDLDAVNTFGQKLSSEIQLSESEILNLIHEQASELMDTENMYIALYDRETDTVRFGLMYVDGKPTYVESRRGGKGRTEWIIRNREPILDLTKEQSQAWYKMDGRQEYIGEPFASWIGVPMIVRDQVIGVIATYNKDKDFVYDEDDLLILESMASQAASALDNARLLNQVEEQKEQLEDEYAKLLKLTRELEEKNVQLVRLTRELEENNANLDKELRSSRQQISQAEQTIVINSFIMDILHRVPNLVGTIPLRADTVIRKLKGKGADADIELAIKQIEGIKKDSEVLLSSVKKWNPVDEALKQIPEDVGVLLNSALRNTLIPENVAIETKFEENVPSVLCNPKELFESFRCIIENGLQAMPNGGSLSVKSSSIKKQGKSWIEVIIADNGQGIQPENLPKIFDLGFTTKESGLGYGLWRTRAVIEKIGGSIAVDSVVNQGTTFSINLPGQEGDTKHV